MSEALSLAKACAKAAHDIQAENIQVVDLKGISNLTDYMVVCSGTSMPHLKAILRDIEKDVAVIREERPHYSEGKADSRWMVLDYIDVMVHIMHEEMRELYCLEELWKDGSNIDWAEGLDLESAE